MHCKGAGSNQGVTVGLDWQGFVVSDSSGRLISSTGEVCRNIYGIGVGHSKPVSKVCQHKPAALDTVCLTITVSSGIDLRAMIGLLSICCPICTHLMPCGHSSAALSALYLLPYLHSSAALSALICCPVDTHLLPYLHSSAALSALICCRCRVSATRGG